MNPMSSIAAGVQVVACASTVDAQEWAARPEVPEAEVPEAEVPEAEGSEAEERLRFDLERLALYERSELSEEGVDLRSPCLTELPMYAVPPINPRSK